MDGLYPEDTSLYPEADIENRYADCNRKYLEEGRVSLQLYGQLDNEAFTDTEKIHYRIPYLHRAKALQTLYFPSKCSTEPPYPQQNVIQIPCITRLTKK
jgi:hypothetical protein